MPDDAIVLCFFGYFENSLLSLLVLMLRMFSPNDEEIHYFAWSVFNGEYIPLHLIKTFNVIVVYAIDDHWFLEATLSYNGFAKESQLSGSMKGKLHQKVGFLSIA